MSQTMFESGFESGSKAEGPSLPALRQDLRLMPAAPAPDGKPRFLLHDPVAGRYHRLGRRAVDLLSGRVSPDAEEAEAFSLFLSRHKLTRDGLGAGALAGEEVAARPSLSQLLVHKYLFFRIPLTRPQHFLDAAAPFVSFAFKRWFWILTALTGFAGLSLAARQWEDFASTFLGFLTPQGMLGYGLTLCALKVLHELGHGFTAQRFGVRVPVMGVAFLVMFPVLYTDTTDGWALTDKRKRVLIDAAGMLCEIAIACFAIFAWSFLPDGPARQIAFFVATTSWTMSLLVNLNPCMRFDGYYLISDSLGVANLQSTGFGLGRWKMRETLFGLGEPKPDLGDADGPGMERVLLSYAYATWVYRFFLFIGIAILVHHLFPKAIGIVLFCVEIGMFIALPMWRELRHWIGERTRILASRRGRMTLLGAGLATVALFAPLSSRVSAPALLSPEKQTDVFAPEAARVEAVLVEHGQRVSEGDVLLQLSSATVAHSVREAELSVLSATAELARARANRDYSADIDPLTDGLARAQSQFNAALALCDRLSVRAPHAGTVEIAGGELHDGRYVGATQALMSVRSDAMIVDVRVDEIKAARLRPDAKAQLFSDRGRMRARVKELAPVTESELRVPALASIHGGAILVDVEEDGALRPRQPVLAARLNTELQSPRERRGTVFIEAERMSVARRIWRRVAAVLIRETDF